MPCWCTETTAVSQNSVDLFVHYPVRTGRLVLRTVADWTADLSPIAVDRAASAHRFRVAMHSPYLYVKPVLLADGQARWSIGDNYLVLGNGSPAALYPYFDVDETCSACELRHLADDCGRQHAFRVFYPPGYHENTLRRYPVLYMQDGQNVFFAEEAFLGEHWRVAETLGTLDAMNAIRQAIVVGIYPNDRMVDYTAPGYEAYGRFVVSTLKPFVDEHFRTLPDPSHTGVMGSSLGGVVSFFLAWQYPEVFGFTISMSSTFGWRDDLHARVACESRRPGRIYLDSGWPQDNYEVTRDMRALLLRRGYREGTDLFYFAFPRALHDERHWAMRCHIPFQLFAANEAVPWYDAPTAANRQLQTG